MGVRRASLIVAAAATIFACGSDVGEERSDPLAPRPDEEEEINPFVPAGGFKDVPSITPGAIDRILLAGTIVTPFEILEGEVLVEGDLITCVKPGKACADRPGANGATIISTAGVIAPGLIDTHNHILFDIFDEDDWKPMMAYQNHDQWTNEPRYQAMLDAKQCLANDSQGKPAWCASLPYGTPQGSLRCEIDKYGELKGLIAGTTSIVGLPGTSLGCFASLARSIDVAQNQLGSDRVQTSALFPPSNPDGVCTNLASGTTTAFLVHVGEGLDERSRSEFSTLGNTATPQCLYTGATAITHGTAFTADEFATMAGAGMKLIWSPRSNVSLYGQTTNIPLALAAGVPISIAPDWSMGGSQNILDELRFAKTWDGDHWGNVLTTKNLVQSVTINAARALALEGRIGTIEEGKLADIAVFLRDRTRPFEAIVGATPRDVSLVLVGGVVLYGDAMMMPAAPAAPGCEALEICGVSKFACVATTTTSAKLDQTYATIKGSLEKALAEVDGLTPDDGWNFFPLTPLVKCP